MAFAGARLALTPLQPGGHWELPCVPETEGWLWGGSGGWVSLSPGAGTQVWAAAAGQGTGQGVPWPRDGSQVCAPLLPWHGAAARPQRSVYFPG